MLTFYLKSMGCKSNQFEGQIIEEKLISQGFERVATPDLADYFILNSCTVTHKSDNEVMYILRNHRGKYPNSKIVLTGCFAQVEKDVLQNSPYVDFIFGNDDKFEMAEYLKNDEKNVVNDIMSVDEFNLQVLEDTTKTRISLKIQDGCNNRCSYCIIPFARGKSRSASVEFIVNQINKYAQNGYKEVVLTGIHIGQWAEETNGHSLELLDLLKAIEETEISRYRLGSLNPLEIPYEVLDFLKTSTKFCPHFHLSLQSACDSTLKRMNRFYKTEDYLKQIDYIVENFENPFIGSDVIAGFVGETEGEFATTVENLKRSRLSQIHTFPYSIRKGTIAEGLVGHLTDEVKTKRAEVIKSISKEKYDEFLSKNIGTIREVLVEKRPDKKTGMLKGVTDNYITVLLENGQDEYKTLQRVELTRVEDGRVFGKIV